MCVYTTDSGLVQNAKESVQATLNYTARFRVRTLYVRVRVGSCKMNKPVCAALTVPL
jgi:hypothetical protein